MATSLDKWKYATDASSARNALSYGLKNAKIGAVDPEIFDEIRQFFWPRHAWRSQMSPVNSGVTEPNFTKLSHDIQESFAVLTRIAILWYWIRFIALVHPMPGYQSTLIHFRNIIWLPWQCPLINWEKSYRLIICT